MSKIALAHIRGGRPTRLKAGISRVEDLANGQEALGSPAIGAKTVYYCDGNAGLDANSGIGGWENSFKTLAVALAASHADIALNKFGWAARNVIYCRGDTFTEDLVLWGQKTDIIGLGSFNHNQMPGLVGNHVPITNNAFGLRFYNFFFQAPAGGGDIFILGATSHGVQFRGCKFSADSTTAATAAIVSTGAAFVEIHNCKFTGKFSDAAVEFGNGDTRGMRFVGNHVEGANDGLHLNSGVLDGSTGEEEYILVTNNDIVTATIGINDASSLAYINDNRVYTDNAKGSNGAGAIVGALDRGQDNRITTSDANNVIWPAQGAL